MEQGRGIIPTQAAATIHTREMGQQPTTTRATVGLTTTSAVFSLSTIHTREMEHRPTTTRLARDM